MTGEATAAGLTPWRIAGSYFESCNCDAICPSRRVSGVTGGRSTHGICFGVLSWHVETGDAGDLDCPKRRPVRAQGRASRVAQGEHAVPDDEGVACGIPEDDPFAWALEGNCAFASRSTTRRDVRPGAL